MFATLYWLVLEGSVFSPATALIGAGLIAGYYIYDYYYGGDGSSTCGDGRQTCE
jgi:hypothetical protein